MHEARQIADVVARRCDATFLIDAASGSTWTYGAFDAWARSLAAALGERGLRPGDRLGLLLSNGPAFVALYFACLYAGVTAVPVNAQLSRKEVAFIIGNAGLAACLYDSQTAALFEEVRAVAQGLTGVLVHPGADDAAPGQWAVFARSDRSAPAPAIRDDALFSLNFTSGTTSMPKGVPHRVAGLFGAARAFNAHTGIHEGHRFYHVLPMAYMAGFLNTILCPFIAGGSVVLGAPFSPMTMLRFWAPVRAHGVNALWLVPTMLAALLRGDRDPWGRTEARRQVELVCVGTAPLPAKLKADFEGAYGVSLHESYGLSETLFVSGNAPGIAFKPGSVGRPLAGISLRILADDGAPAPQGTDGEIFVQAAWNMAGYFDYATKTAAPAGDTWFASGDIGHLDLDGYLFITSRKKDLIIRGGQNISPRAVEELIETHPAVQHVAVVGVPHEFYGEEVIAILVLRDGFAFETVRPEIEALCRANLSASAIPTRFLPRRDMPLSVTGKLQKHRLREWVVAGASPESA